jgi:RNA polymerase sigma-70 factor (ECF subfamily)
MRHPRHSAAAVLRESPPALYSMVERARSGDNAAIRGLIELYQGRVARFVRSMLRDDDEWEDVAQATFVKMILGISRLRSEEIFESWLFRIARNSSLDHLRRRKWRRIFIPWEPRHAEIIAPGPNFKNMQLDQVERALTELPLEQRELILLMRENDWSYGDLARIIGVSTSAVRSRLFRARSRLRALMEEGETS